MAKWGHEWGDLCGRGTTAINEFTVMIISQFPGDNKSSSALLRGRPAAHRLVAQRLQV
jgi:hypothetical protein